MILSNISVPLLGLVDTAVIGHLDSPIYLAGVALGAMVVNLLFWLAGFLRMSMTGLTAQAYGEKNSEQLLSDFKKGLLVALLIALIIVITSPAILYLLKLFLSGSEDAVQQALIYIEIRLYSAPAALLNMVILGWLLGTQYSKGPLYIVLLTNIGNIVLDIVFVIGLEWSVAGAAWASLCADYIALFVAIYIVNQRLQLMSLSLVLLIKAQLGSLRCFLNLNLAIFIRSLFLQICFAFMTYYGATLGDVVVAANAVLLNFLLLVSFALDGIAYAAEAKVGKAKGQRQMAQLHTWVKVSVFWAVLFSLLYSLIFLLWGANIIGLLTDLDKVAHMAQDYLPWLVILPVISSLCFIFDGIFVGLTRAKEMRNSMIFSSLIGFFGVFLLVIPYQNHGLWFAMSCFMLLRGLTLAKKYRDLYRRDQLLI